jgi:hypothetical protein
MPVYKLLQEMPQEELMKWGDYFRKRPLGWREDQRTFLMLQAQGYKGDPGSVFASLKQLKDNIPAEVKSLPKGKFLDMMITSAKKEGSDWTPFWVGNK